MGNQTLNANHCTMTLVQDGADDLQELSLKAMTSAPDVSASAPSSGTQITAMPVELLDHIASNLEEYVPSLAGSQ